LRAVRQRRAKRQRRSKQGSENNTGRARPDTGHRVPQPVSMVFAKHEAQGCGKSDCGFSSKHLGAPYEQHPEVFNLCGIGRCFFSRRLGKMG
jgi:hypothetical protein